MENVVRRRSALDVELEVLQRRQAGGGRFLGRLVEEGGEDRGAAGRGENAVAHALELEGVAGGEGLGGEGSRRSVSGAIWPAAASCSMNWPSRSIVNISPSGVRASVSPSV